jgi:hypothetical protein
MMEDEGDRQEPGGNVAGVGKMRPLGRVGTRRGGGQGGESSFECLLAARCSK